MSSYLPIEGVKGENSILITSIPLNIMELYSFHIIVSTNLSRIEVIVSPSLGKNVMEASRVIESSFHIFFKELQLKEIDYGITSIMRRETRLDKISFLSHTHDSKS